MVHSGNILVVTDSCPGVMRAVEEWLAQAYLPSQLMWIVNPAVVGFTPHHEETVVEAVRKQYQANYFPIMVVAYHDFCPCQSSRESKSPYELTRHFVNSIYQYGPQFNSLGVLIDKNITQLSLMWSNWEQINFLMPTPNLFPKNGDPFGYNPYVLAG